MTRARQEAEIELPQVGTVDGDGSRLRIVQPAQQLGDGGFAGAVLAHDGERRSGGDGEVEVLEHGDGACPVHRRVGEADIVQTNFLRRRRIRAAVAGGQRAGGTHGRFQAQHGGHRGCGPIERPTESAKGDHRYPDRALHVNHGFSQGDAAVGNVARQQPEDDHVGRDHQEQAPNHRALSHTGSGILQLVQSGAPGDKAINRPGGEAEQPQLLARRRIDGQPVGVVGIPLRSAHFRILAVAPNAALPQQPMSGQPGAGQQQRSPPRVAQEDDRGSNATDHLDQAVGNKIHGDGERRPSHAQVKVAGHGEVGGQGGIFEVADAGRAHTGFGQPIVEPGRGAVAQVGTERLVNGAEHLQQDKDAAGKCQRFGERVAALHGADQHAHGDGKRCRQDAAQQQHRPPARSQSRSRFGQDGEELPFLASRQ